MPLLNVNNRLIMGLVAVIVILSLIAGVLVGLRFQAFVPFQPDTQTSCSGTWGGIGQFPDAVTDGVKHGEVFSRDKTYLSWVPTGTALPFSVAGGVVGGIESGAYCGTVIGLTPRYLRETFSINTGLGYGAFRQDDVPEGMLLFQSVTKAPPREISIDGTTYEDGNGVTRTIPDGSVLRVTVEIGFERLFGGVDWYGPMAVDEIRLVSGLPKLQRGAAQYEVGEIGSFSWQVPVVSIDGRTAYYLSVIDENTGNPVGGWSRTPLSTLNGVARFDVTQDLFSTSLSARNTVRARLFSEIFQADVTDVTVIDNADLAPRINSVTVNQREFREGDTVRVHIDASPNPSTKFSIVRYHVLAHIGGDIVYDLDSTSPDVSFVASRTGILAIEAVAYDTANRPSPVYEFQATVGNVIVDCEVYPDLPQCGTRTLLPLIVAVIVVVVAFIGAVTIAAMAPAKFRLPIFIGAVVIAALVLTAIGAFDAIGAALGT